VGNIPALHFVNSGRPYQFQKVISVGLWNKSAITELSNVHNVLKKNASFLFNYFKMLRNFKLILDHFIIQGLE